MTRNQFLRMVEQSGQQPAQVAPSPEISSNDPAPDSPDDVQPPDDHEMIATTTPDSDESDMAVETAVATSTPSQTSPATTTPADEVEPANPEEASADDDAERAPTEARDEEPLKEEPETATLFSESDEESVDPL